MYTFTFNSGRQYTAEGQIISVAFDGLTQMVYFNDHSRMVDGFFQASESLYEDMAMLPTALAREVMHRYDRGEKAGVKYYCLPGYKPQRQDFVHEFRI